MSAIRGRRTIAGSYRLLVDFPQFGLLRILADARMHVDGPSRLTAGPRIPLASSITCARTRVPALGVRSLASQIRHQRASMLQKIGGRELDLKTSLARADKDSRVLLHR